MSSKLNKIAMRRYKIEIARPYIKMIARIILVPTITVLVLFIIYVLE